MQSVARWLSFKRVTPQVGVIHRLRLYSLKTTTTGKYRSELSFKRVTLQDQFDPQTQKLEPLVQRNKQYQRKVSLSSFPLNGHVSRFHPQRTQGIYVVE